MLERVQSSQIDIARYVGTGKSRTWKQVVSFPAWFQKDIFGKLLKDVTATYTMMNGYVEVRNSGVDSRGKMKVQIGKAYLAKQKNVLGVKFFQIQPSADYIIEFVDKDYKYAVVGSSRKNYLWILARGKVTREIYEQLVAHAKSLGYDTSRLVE